MAKSEINIELRAAGGSRVAGEFGKIGKASTDLIVNVKKIGNAFGELGGNIGGLLQNILKGGVFGIVQSVIDLGISLVGKLRASWKKADEDIAKAEKETHEKRMKHLAEYATAAEKASAARKDAIDKELSSLKEEINATKELTKATLELKRASAFKKGDKDEIERIDKQLKGADAEAAAEVLLAEMAAAEKRVDSGRRDYKRALIGRGSAQSEVSYISAQIEDALNSIRDEAAKSAKGKATVVNSVTGSIVTYAKATAEDQKAAADAATEAYKTTDAYKSLEERLKAAKDKVKGFQDTMDAAQRSINAATATRNNLDIRADTLLAVENKKKIEEQLAAKDTVKALDEYKRYQASGSWLSFDQWKEKDKEDRAKALLEQKKQYRDYLRDKLGQTAPYDASEISENDEGFKKFIKDRADAEKKAAEDVAKQREENEKRLHQQRMDNLRAQANETRRQLAEQTKAASMQRAVASRAQSEFDRAFAMFRDPDRAAAEIGEEKAYQKDLDRLHKSASRYGGKWRIDELSRLMAAGDSQGVTDTLAGWRKSRGFTPEVEAMVRAAAAEQTKTTAEEELRKIEANTAGLADKLEELLSMKGT